MCVYIYTQREREREREDEISTLGSSPDTARPAAYRTGAEASRIGTPSSSPSVTAAEQTRQNGAVCVQTTASMRCQGSTSCRIQHPFRQVAPARILLSHGQRWSRRRMQMQMLSGLERASTSEPCLQEARPCSSGDLRPISGSSHTGYLHQCRIQPPLPL